MKNYILDKLPNSNVIALDWSKPAGNLDYFEAAANTKIVGALVAYFINRLHNVTNVGFKSFHLSGHSLGAHVMGFAGASFAAPQKPSKISGFDPAGPGFMINDPNTRLDKTDADLVCVIHTNLGGFILFNFTFYSKYITDLLKCKKKYFNFIFFLKH
jgi:hypothetical protein